MPVKMTNDAFQNRVSEKFDNRIECLDKFISYRKSTKMKFKCNSNPLHDEIFICSAQGILRSKGTGCPFCDGQKKTNKMVKSELYEKYCKKIKLKNDWNHNEDDCNSNRIFVCEEHGEFESSLNLVLNSYKYGCMKCALPSRGKTKQKVGLNNILKKLEEFTNGDIILKDETYNGVNEDATFICKKHGEFKRKPGKILYSNRITCPYCSMSNGEYIILEILKKLGYEENKNLLLQHTFDKLIYKRKLKFDFFLPNENILIEFDGKQHYDSDSSFYSEDQQVRDELKNLFCKENNIRLIRFIDNSKEITNSKISLMKKSLEKIIKDKSSTTIEKVKLF